MTLGDAKTITGGLTMTTKMPCYSYSLPAKECKVGSLLRKVKGSACSHCYALKGNYVKYAKTIEPAMYRRLASITRPEWTGAMVTLIGHYSKESKVFRWHDSGDIQNMRHLLKIVEIARRLPHIKFWIPTREYKTVRAYLKRRDFPPNLAIRISVPMVGQMPGKGWPLTSTINTNHGHVCPAYNQGGQCGNCRACWNTNVSNVDYPLH